MTDCRWNDALLDAIRIDFPAPTDPQATSPPQREYWDLIHRHQVAARFSGGHSRRRLQEVRVELGCYILAGIEFMIASDIIHTVLSRELMDLAFVSALVLIRTAISFFLSREVKELEAPDDNHLTERS